MFYKILEKNSWNFQRIFFGNFWSQHKQIGNRLKFFCCYFGESIEREKGVAKWMLHKLLIQFLFWFLEWMDFFSSIVLWSIYILLAYLIVNFKWSWLDAISQPLLSFYSKFFSSIFLGFLRHIQQIDELSCVEGSAMRFWESYGSDRTSRAVGKFLVLIDGQLTHHFILNSWFHPLILLFW